MRPRVYQSSPRVNVKSESFELQKDDDFAVGWTIGARALYAQLLKLLPARELEHPHRVVVKTAFQRSRGMGLLISPDDRRLSIADGLIHA